MIVAVAAQLAFATPSTQELTEAMLRDISVASEVKLVSAGKAPLRVVNFDPKPGASTTLKMSTRQTLQMGLTGPDGVALPMPDTTDLTPTTVMTMRQSVGEPLGNGMLPIQVHYLGFSATGGSPDVRTQVEQSLAPMKDLRYSLLWDPKQGRIVQVDVSGSSSLADAAQQMADQVAQNVVTFPREPIGVGATWTVDMDMNIAGLELQSTQAFTLKALTADAATVDVTLTMSMGDGPMNLPGLPPGAKVDFQRFDAKGSGVMTMNLRDLSSASSMTTTMDMAMSMSGEGMDAMAMTMAMTQTITTEATDAKR